jgi:hypothetical protein
MPADFPLVSQHPGAMPYHLVRARDTLGGEETWLLTESELARIRERAAGKPEFTRHVLSAFTAPVAGWRAALGRWLGGFV